MILIKILFIRYVVNVKSCADAGSDEAHTTATLDSEWDISSDQPDGSKVIKDL
jgi:hypothetical protein